MKRAPFFALALAGCHIVAGVEDGELAPDAGTGGTTAAGGNGGSGGASAAGGSAGTGGLGGSAGAGGSTGGSAGNGGSAASGGSGGNGGSAATPGMLLVPAGTFSMGCNSGVDAQCNPDENPYHEVTLSSFEIDVTEVTRGDYKDCIDAGVCATPSCDWDASGLADHPVTCVSWNDAKQYCEWLGKRLPTEAEWEMACRGDTGRKYPWGQDFADNCNYANANLCSFDTKPVATHPTGASPHGVLDLSGNVAEWVNDFYDAAYYAASPTTDPPGPASGGVRGVRGGSWNSAVYEFRCSSRAAALPTTANDETGFRCAK